MPPTATKYGPLAGAETPVAPLHSAEPESPLEAEKVMPFAAPCWAIWLVEVAKAVSPVSQPPNEEFSTSTMPSATARL